MKAYINEYSDTLKAVQNTSSATIASSPQWEAPQVETVKCNCDASYSASLRKAGVGFVCKDHEGTVLKATSCPSSFTDILVGESLVVRLAMMEMIVVGYERVVIESDNSCLINYIMNGGRASPLHIRILVDDIIHLASSFVSCNFVCIPREINSVVGSLARRALSVACTTDWPLSTPWLSEFCSSLPP
ncbi:uncharacterized protein LOC122639844 [Telopea speciosissima]|uniref:uncharacterized protein LOC122639844 n=1 Tax=Telopea speciosissima TaxID=54955 RepID=UPI001CC603C1|nr:uncharacterized protein LOC122639844 [Telopea speciosissima]